MANVQIQGYEPPQNTKINKVDMHFCLFFDGTRNNKNNTDLRLKNDPIYTKNKKDDSYNNDYSNVARMWTNAKSDKRIYIEGIGTTNKAADDTLGYALGSFRTGIRSKVRAGCKDLAKKIFENLNGAELGTVTLDVFGFSRGAAAARNFVFEISKPKYKTTSRYYSEAEMTVELDSDGYPVNQKEMPEGGNLGYELEQLGLKNINWSKIKVQLLGVYDTVSSYSNEGLLPRFSNNVKQLSLRSLAKAKEIVHFVAADEIRENFALTRIDTTPKRGIEKTFPGVHSDIGGSYETGREAWEEVETSWTFKSRLEKVKTRLVEEGWYLKDEMAIKLDWLGYFALSGDKPNIYKEFSYIPLHFMADYCEMYDVQVNKAKTVSKYVIDNHKVLVSVKDNLKNYVMNRDMHQSPYTFSDNMNVTRKSELYALRKEYLHRSARREGIGMDPTSNWVRTIY